MVPVKLRGILTDIFPIENFTNFSKRVFWLKEPDVERYPQHFELTLLGNDLTQIDRFKIGDHLEIDIELRGRKSTHKRTNAEAIYHELKVIGILLLKRPGAEETKIRVTGKVKPDDAQGALDL